MAVSFSKRFLLASAGLELSLSLKDTRNANFEFSALVRLVVALVMVLSSPKVMFRVCCSRLYFPSVKLAVDCLGFSVACGHHQA